MAGYQVGIASETKAFKQGVESGIIEPLEDAQKELVELGKSKGPDQLEKGMKDAERATEKLGDETKRTAKAIEQEFRDTYRKTKQSSDDATRKMSEGFDDVKQEAEQSAKETFASFDGSFESIIDMAQEVSAQAFSGFGPAGLAAGLLAAGGIGLVTSEFSKQQEEAEKLRGRLSGLYQEALESGREYIDQSQFIAEGNDLRFNPDRAEEWKNLQADAVRLGLDENAMIKANSGDLEAQAEVFRRINDLKNDKTSEAYYTTQRDGLVQLTPEMQLLEDRWRGINEVTEKNAAAVQDARQSNSDFLMEMISQAGTAAQEVDELGNRLITLPTGEEILIDVETGQATLTVDKFKGDTDEVIDQLNGREVVINTRAAIAQAQRDLNQFITQNDGRTVKINGRFTVNNGTWDQ